MKVQFVETCVGERFYFSKGDIIDTNTADVLDRAMLTSFLQDQVKAGHCIELETGAKVEGAKVERAINKAAIEKR